MGHQNISGTYFSHLKCNKEIGMKKIKLQTLLMFLFIILLFISCKKKEDVDPLAPIIALSSVSASTIEQFNNSVQIIFSYEDYQGDLGEQDPDDYSLRVLDARLGDYDWFHIPPMTPEENILHIKGSYVLTLDPLFILGSGTQESTSFQVQLQDRAGNWSNIIETPVVLIVDSL